jgi:hypothetical protein
MGWQNGISPNKPFLTPPWIKGNAAKFGNREKYVEMIAGL